MDALTLGLALGVDPTARTVVEALEHACALKENVGFGAVEVFMEPHYYWQGVGLWPWEFDDHTVSEMGPLLKEFPCRGAHLPFVFGNIICPNRPIRDESVAQLEEGLDVCGALGLSYAVSHLRYETLGVYTRAEEHELLRQTLARLGTSAGRHNVALWVENADTIQVLDDLVEVVEPLARLGIGIVLDAGHANLGSGWGTFGSAAGFPPAKAHLVRSIHISDNHGLEDEHLQPGRGTTEFAPLLAALGQVGHPTVVTFEFHATAAEYVEVAEKVRGWWRGALGT